MRVCRTYFLSFGACDATYLKYLPHKQISIYSLCTDDASTVLLASDEAENYGTTEKNSTYGHNLANFIPTTAVTHCDMLFWADHSALSHRWTALQCCRTFRFKKHPKLILTPLFQSTPISFGQIGQSQTSRIIGSSWSSSKMWDIDFAHKINLLIFRNFRIFGLGLPYYFDQCENISKFKKMF